MVIKDPRTLARIRALVIPRQIFLIATYRRVSGSALTASTPTAIPATVRVIAVTYPSARIIFLLICGGSATAVRDI